MVWFLIEEHLSVIHTSHVPLVCVPCEPYGSAHALVWVCEMCNLKNTQRKYNGFGYGKVLNLRENEQKQHDEV